jgi:hypothetical protein
MTHNLWNDVRPLETLAGLGVKGPKDTYLLRQKKGPADAGPKFRGKSEFGRSGAGSRGCSAHHIDQVHDIAVSKG